MGLWIYPKRIISHLFGVGIRLPFTNLTKPLDVGHYALICR